MEKIHAARLVYLNDEKQPDLLVAGTLILQNFEKRDFLRAVLFLKYRLPNYKWHYHDPLKINRQNKYYL